MVELKANSTDAAGEKHVPVITVEGNKVHVVVGSVLHPMTEEHSIQFIALETKRVYNARHYYLQINQSLTLYQRKVMKLQQLMNTATYTAFGRQKLNQTHKGREISFFIV